jgi:hypothetical protein
MQKKKKFEGISQMYLFMLGWYHPSVGKAWSKEDFMTKMAITATDYGCKNSLMELHAMCHVVLIELNRFEGQLSDWKFPTPWAEYEMRTGLMQHTQNELRTLVNELQELIKH